MQRVTQASHDGGVANTDIHNKSHRAAQRNCEPVQMEEDRLMAENQDEYQDVEETESQDENKENESESESWEESENVDHDSEIEEIDEDCDEIVGSIFAVLLYHS